MEEWLLADVQKAVEKEFELALQDRVMEETKDKKNAVEAYVYDLRNKVDEDGEDETEGVYIARLEKLQQQEVPLRSATRSTLGTGRALVIDQLICCVNSFRETTMSSDPKFDHSDLVEKQKVMNECMKQRLLRERKQLQDLLPKYATPVIFSADIERRPALDSHLCNSGEQLRSNMVKSLTAAKEGINDKGEREGGGSVLVRTRCGWQENPVVGLGIVEQIKGGGKWFGKANGIMLSSYHQPIILASCVPPPEEFFEVNVDGSLNVRNKRAVEVAEALAVSNGLSFAADVAVSRF
ncbi:hypothetical protein RHGRI_001999 [Rhododendron griersonianum]|nr:hypothetical protein RHGRI_001999 [Rhododendron griersonianum]